MPALLSKSRSATIKFHCGKAETLIAKSYVGIFGHPFKDAAEMFAG